VPALATPQACHLPRAIPRDVVRWQETVEAEPREVLGQVVTDQ
jgi:hypothetical protein